MNLRQRIFREAAPIAAHDWRFGISKGCPSQAKAGLKATVAYCIRALPWQAKSLRNLVSTASCQRILGEVPEWLNGAVSKTVERASVPGVRIPLSPPITLFKSLILNNKSYFNAFCSPNASPIDSWIKQELIGTARVASLLHLQHLPL